MRPDIWIGHVDLRTANLDESEAFMKEIGLRAVFRNDNVAVLELRGGNQIRVNSTHVKDHSLV